MIVRNAVLLGASANCEGRPLSFSYVCPQGVTRLPLAGCLSNFIMSLESLETVQVPLKSHKNTGYFTRRPTKRMAISR